MRDPPESGNLFVPKESFTICIASDGRIASPAIRTSTVERKKDPLIRKKQTPNTKQMKHKLPPVVRIIEEERNTAPKLIHS